MVDKGITNRSPLVASGWDVVSLLLPVVVGGCCIGLWWLEQTFRLGWSGEAWLQQHWWSIYPIVGLVIAVFLWPLRQTWSIPWRWMIAYALLLSGVSWGAYVGTRSVFDTLYSTGLLRGDTTVVTASIWKLFGVVLVVAGAYFIPLWQFHHSTDRLHLLTLVEAFVLVIPCSLISLELLPFIGEGHTFVDAVRLGYPFFWVPFFLGYLSLATAKEWI